MAIQNYISGSSAVNIAKSIEQAVISGRAAGGSQLPPVRSLAISLGVSPATVAAAYRVLQDRGVVVAEGRRGTRVRQTAPLATAAAIALPEHVRDLASGNPDLALLPDLGAALARTPIEQRPYGDDLNDPKLIELARAQFIRDGIAADHVAVVSGALDGIERVLREHLRAGDRVAVEDPCFTGILDLLGALSLVAVPVAINDEGLVVAQLQKLLRSIDALVLTPRAQNPSGAALTESRAKRLRTILAARPDLLVIEDDHAGPIAGVQYVSLVDAKRERWAIVRSVSKSLGPDLRLAVMAADAQTATRVEGRQRLGIRWVSHVLQQLVVQMWSDRATQRVLAKAERTYTARRKALLQALAARGVTAHGASGLNVWIPVAEESATVQGLFAKGWAVQAGERYRIDCGPAIRVTIATLAAQDATRFADDLVAVIRPRGDVSSGA